MTRSRADVQALPPWLAFERRILVKRDAPARLRRELIAGAGNRRDDRHRHRDRSLSTRGAQLPRDARRARGAGGSGGTVARHHHEEPTRHARHRSAAGDSRDVRGSRSTSRSSRSTADSRAASSRARPTPESRLRAIERLSAAGIDVGVNVMPVLPGITDDPLALEALVRRIAETGASHVHAGSLRLRREAFERYLPVVERDFPELADRYRRTYARSSEASDRYRDGLQSRDVATLRRGWTSLRRLRRPAAAQRQCGRGSAAAHAGDDAADRTAVRTIVSSRGCLSAPVLVRDDSVFVRVNGPPSAPVVLPSFSNPALLSCRSPRSSNASPRSSIRRGRKRRGCRRDHGAR